MRPLGIILNTLAQRPPMSFRPAGTGWHGWHAAGSAREKGGMAPRRARGPGAIDTYPPEPEPEPDPTPAAVAGWWRRRLSFYLARWQGWPWAGGPGRLADLEGRPALCFASRRFQFSTGGIHMPTHTRTFTPQKRERDI